MKKYFKLNNQGTKWVECGFDGTKKQITLYDYDDDGFIIEIGVGLY